VRKNITIPPPSPLHSFGPSQLFRFFFRLGRWTEESFSDDFQTYTRGKLFSTRDLFIPLQLVETEHDEISLYEIDDLLALAAAGTTHKQMGQWGLISGPAGSGKSMLALHLANALAQTDVMPIFLRGQNISDII